MLVEVVVQQGADHVVGGGDGVEVAREVQVDALHGQHLGVSAAGSAALHAEAGAERRLAQGHDGLLADMVQAEGQADGDGGLADARLRGGDGGDEDEPALLRARQAEGNFGNILAVALQVVGRKAHLAGHVFDGSQRCLACNL